MSENTRTPQGSAPDPAAKAVENLSTHGGACAAYGVASVGGRYAPDPTTEIAVDASPAGESNSTEAAKGAR